MCAIWSQLAQLRRELVKGEEFPRGRRLVGGPPPDCLGFPVIQVFSGVAASRAARTEEPARGKNPREVLGWPKTCKLAHAFLCEYS